MITKGLDFPHYGDVLVIEIDCKIATPTFMCIKNVLETLPQELFSAG